MLAQGALARDEWIRSGGDDGRLDAGDAKCIHDGRAERGDNNQAGQPASGGGDRWQRPNVERDVLTERWVSLAEGYLGLKTEQGLPLAERGQSEAQANQQGDDWYRGDDGGHATRVSVLLGGDAAETEGGPGQVQADERAG